MPGSSLWLTPPPSLELHGILSKLIEETIPAQFPGATPPPPAFSPHLTLTSNIPPSIYGSDPQAWLDSIPFPPASQARVEFERVKTEEVFYRRCYIKCEFDGVANVAAIARAVGVEGERDVGEKTKRWMAEWRGQFGPHVSLMYGDVTIDQSKLKEIKNIVRDSGISFGKPSQKQGGWEGGVVWLVPTDKDIQEWKPIATKVL